MHLFLTFADLSIIHPTPLHHRYFWGSSVGRYPHYSLPNIYINMKVDQKVLHSSMKSLTQMRELCIIVKIFWLAFLICSMLCIGWIVTHKFGKLSQLYVKKWQSVEVGCIEHISAHVGHGRTNLCQANISSWIWFVPQTSCDAMDNWPSFSQMCLSHVRAYVTCLHRKC